MEIAIEDIKKLSQKKLKNYVKDIIEQIGVCESIKKYHSNKFELFLYLFKRHSEYREKFYNLKDIKLKYNLIFKNQLECIILKHNGEEDNVSILNNCITGKPKCNLTIAMRNSITEQILSFKNNNNLKKCELCCATKELVVDHYFPLFSDLKNDFLSNYLKKDIPSIFREDKSNSKIFMNNDSNFEKKWKEYHLLNAKLRYLCKKCNNKIENKKSFKNTFKPKYNNIQKNKCLISSDDD